MAREAGSTTARGRSAEQRVAQMLAGRGWVIVGTNIRVGRDEVDIAALDGVVLVVVEVRSRAAGAIDDPLTSIRAAKKRRLRRAAIHLAARYRHDAFRIDVASVVGDTIDVIENAIDFTST